MKKLLVVAVLFSFLFGCQSTHSSSDSSNSVKENWISLFNGKDLSDWEIKIAGYSLNENYKETFVVEDSMIRIKYDNYENFDDAFGHLYYKTPYSYYKIKFDYRFLGKQIPGGASWNVRNSGIMFHSQSAKSNELGQGFPVSVELQLLGGLGEGDRTTGNVCTPGTAVMMGDTINFNHCINSTSATYHGDRWVQVEAIVLGGESMVFLIEGDTVLTFQKPLIGGGFLSKENEGKDWDQFKIVRDKEDWIAKDSTILAEGYIALQAESHPIDFKNIRLLDLCGCMDEQAKNYKDYFVCSKPKSCVYE
ncbi:MAG: hypothetical protein ACJAT4_001773 [Granulosicoccus sp.]|jgi:hypothetical protein